MTLEARLAFIFFFLLLWCGLGMISWSAAAVLTRGRGALLALPLALAAAAALGILVPLAGLRDLAGLLLSLPVAIAGGALGAWAGIAFSRRLDATRSRALPAVQAAPAAGVSESPSDTLEP